MLQVGVIHGRHHQRLLHLTEGAALQPRSQVVGVPAGRRGRRGWEGRGALVGRRCAVGTGAHTGGGMTWGLVPEHGQRLLSSWLGRASGRLDGGLHPPARRGARHGGAPCDLMLDGGLHPLARRPRPGPGHGLMHAGAHAWRVHFCFLRSMLSVPANDGPFNVSFRRVEQRATDGPMHQHVDAERSRGRGRLRLLTPGTWPAAAIAGARDKRPAAHSSGGCSLPPSWLSPGDVRLLPIMPPSPQRAVLVKQ